MLSQLSFFLPTSLSFADLRLLYGANGVDVEAALKNSVSAWTGPSVLLVSGSSPSYIGEGRKRIVFGAFIPVPWMTSDSTDFGSEYSCLFQLSPVHEVFRASEAAVQHAQFFEGSLVFGGREGVGLNFNPGLQYGAFRHDEVARGDYQSFGLRQGLLRDEEFKVEELEVWGFGGEWVRTDKPISP